MPLQPASRLGNYEVLSELGSGGMGEVYKAKDLKLGRTVAIKVLPQEMAMDSQRLRRFEREARAASALNHPNIVTIYEIGEHQGAPYIAMEYVEGRTLRELLTEGPLTSDKLVRYATQMAEGLAKAHQAGIVHRDLKPENIVISSDGYVKILDFGLAKLIALEDVGSDVATIEQQATTPGTIVGTASYMSPEQAKGQPCDFRSDQFSFGAVLYEMSTGKRAFGRETAAESLAAVLKEEPTLDGALTAIVGRCLRKDPSERWGDTDDLRVALLELDSPPEKKSSMPSIAVLPFTNMSGDPEQEYFCDGMAEEIINLLAQVKGMRVVARTSAFAFKDKNSDIREIGRTLGVDMVLEGSVRKSGKQVRVTGQLIDVASGFHLWSERYDGVLEDLFATQDEIASKIASKLKAELPASGHTHHPQNVDAYEAYMRGRFHWSQMTLDGYTKSIRFFEEAIALDPTYATAYTGLADSHFWLGFAEFMRPKDVFPKAKEAALKALSLDPNLAEAHAALGSVKFGYEWDWAGAERDFKRAIELNPDSALCHQQYAAFLGNMGRMKESFAHWKRALAYDPLGVVWNADYGYFLFVDGRYDAAQAQLKKTIALDPNNAATRWVLATVYLEQGLYDEAIESYQIAISALGGYPAPFISGGLARAYAAAGRKGKATEILGELRELAKERYVSSVPLAWVHIGLGQIDDAFACMETAHSERAFMLINVRTFQWWDPIRDDPRFQDFLRRMNLSK